MNLLKPAMDNSLRAPRTPPYAPTDRQSPWREPYVQTPKEEDDEPQPLDFSRKTTPVTRIPDLQDSVQLTPSPTPPEPPSQAFMHPFSDVMMSFGTTTALATTAIAMSPGAKTVNGDNNPALSSSGSPPSANDVSPPQQVQPFDVNGSLLAPILRQAQPAFPSSEPVRNGNNQTKYTRPFKAYPRDPLSIPLGYYGLPMQLPLSPEALAAQSIITSASDQAYMEYRQRMLITRSRTTADTRRNRTLQDMGSSPTLTRKDNQDSEGEQTSSDNSNGAPPKSNGNSLHVQGEKKRGRLPDDLKDDAYWERRRKNNEAAKRSRDARRAKEDEIAIRAAFLEQENLKLRVEVAALKSELSKLRCLLYSN